MSSPANRPTGAVPAATPVPAAAPVPAARTAAAAATAPAAAPISTPGLLASMLRSAAKVSDLFFSPGKPPLVEINGKLAPAGAARPLSSEDTRRIAADLIGNNKLAAESL